VLVARKIRFAQQTAAAVLFGAAAFVSAHAQNIQDVAAHIEQVQSQNRNNVRPYSVVREYKLLKDGGQQESQVTAEVSFVPPHSKDYQIQNTSGSNQGPKVVKKVLEHESEMTEHWNETAITRDNYEFALAGHDTLRGRNCLVVQLTPKRESKELIEGQAWVDEQNFRILKISGTPSKSPSWWIKRLQITIEYGEVNGMWLQRTSNAQADVRIVGQRTLLSRDVSYRTAEVVADNLPRRGRSTRPATNLASASVN
jgi:outer membrane lipoprotein-sorting protein